MISKLLEKFGVVHCKRCNEWLMAGLSLHVFTGTDYYHLFCYHLEE